MSLLISSISSLPYRFSEAWRDGDAKTGAVVATAAGLALVGCWGLVKLSSSKTTRTMKRSWSFSSLVMIDGGFPEHAEVPEHIINAAMFFANDVDGKQQTMPTDQEFADHVVCPLLAFERLATIPMSKTDQDGNSTRPCLNDNNGVVVPISMVRRISFEGETAEDTHVEILEHLQDSLQGLRPLSSDRISEKVELPWWELLVLENSGNGPSACVLRIHHALADGISLVKAFFETGIVKDANGIPMPIPELAKRYFLPIDRSSQPNFGDGKRAKPSLWTIVSEAFHCLTLGLSKPDDDTVFSRSIHGKMKHSQNRSHVIFPSVPLSFIKSIKDAAGVTINDVVLTAVSQAIRDYCLSQKCPIMSTTNKQIQCRALLPVALPRTSSQSEEEEKTSALTNKWCFVSTDLEVDSDNVLDRLKRIQSSTQAAKSSSRAAIQMAVQNAVVTVLPASLARQTAFDIFSRHSLVFSNVPGPTNPCYLANKQVAGVQMFYGNLIPQISFLSYNGSLFGNLVVDPEHLPDAQSFASFYGKALIAMAEGLHVDTSIPASLASE